MESALKNWHAAIGDPSLADSICDPLLHNAHRIELGTLDPQVAHRLEDAGRGEVMSGIA